MKMKKCLSIGLTVALASSMAVAPVSAREVMDDGEGATYFEKHTIGIIGSMTNWGCPDADGNVIPDIPMTDEDGDGIYVGTTTLDVGTHYFRVRADSEWEDSWGEYEEEYDRTFNSQTNCEAVVEEDGTKLTVKLDANGEDGNVWPVTFTLGEIKNTSTISEQTVLLGDMVTIHCSAVNGNGKRQYKVLYQEPNSTEWKMLSQYSDKKEVMFTPTIVGQYTFRVCVRDAGGMTDEKNLDLNVLIQLLKNTSTISEQTVSLGDMVTIHCSAVNGNGKQQYKVLYQKPSSTAWKTLSSYSDKEKITFKPTLLGDYNIRVRVKDADGTTDEKDFVLYVRTADIDYFYFDNSETKWDSVYAYWWTSDYSPTYDKDGNLYGFVENDTGYEPVRYPGTKMEQIEGTDIWRILIPFSAEKMIFNSGKTDEQIWAGETGYTTGDIAFDSEADAGQIYTIDTSFEPRAGRGVYKTQFRYSVGDWCYYNPTLTNTSSVSTESVTVDNSVTIYCSSSSGKGQKQYKILYQEPNSTTWKTLSAYSDKEEVTFTPTMVGQYTLRVRVKDAEENTDVKDLMLSVTKEPLTNTSTLSKQKILTGGNGVTIHCSAEGGRKERQYMVLYQEPNSTEWETLSNYSSNTEVTFAAPIMTGQYTIRVRVKDADGTTDDKDLVLTVSAGTLKNTSSISQQAVWTGDAVTINCSATGGNGEKQFRLYYQEPPVYHQSPDGYTWMGSSEWKTASAYSSQSKLTFTPTINGEYTLRIRAKDADGKTAAQDFTLRSIGTEQDDRKQYFYYDNSKTNWTNVYVYWISGDDMYYPVRDADGNLYGCKLKDNSSYYERYEFFQVKMEQIPNTSIWQAKVPYGTDGYIRFGNGGSKYQWVDSYGDIDGKICTDAANETWKTYTGTYVSHLPLSNRSTLSQDTAEVGKSLTIRCKAIGGGAGQKQFAVFCRKPNSTAWETLSSYSVKTQVAFTPTEKGTYTIRVRAKDTTGKNVAKDLTLTVTASSLKNTSAIRAASAVEDSGTTVISLGDPLTIDCKAEGGTGDKQFTVLYQKEDQTNWKTLSSYSTNPQVTFKPTAVGTYTIRVRAKDSTGKTAVKNFTVRVIKPLTNNSMLGTASIKLGDSVTIICSAQNGMGSYQYAVYYKKASSDTWTKLRGYNSGYVLSLTPKVAVKYDIRVEAKDAGGNVASKVLTLTVTK